MTILFFSRLFYPHIGGVEKHVLEVGKRLVEKNNRVIVVTEELFGKDISLYQSRGLSANVTEEIEGIEVHRVNSGRENCFSFGKLRINKKKFRIWRWLWRHRDLIKDTDIVHCHDVFFWYLPFRFLYPNKPVYTTFHGYESYPIKKTAIIVRKISELLSFGNICIGDYIKKSYGTKPDFISYGGVDINKYQKLNIKNQISDEKKNALFVGRLDEQTGILQYCKAAELVRKTYPEFELVIVGDGHLRESTEKYGKVLGFIDNPEKLFPRYRFAFVSRYLSILEALASKRLVFAVYDNPIKKDYLLLSPLSEFIVVVGSSKQLAEKVVWFIDHRDEERKLIERGYAFVVKQTWSSLVEKYLELWKIGS